MSSRKELLGLSPEEIRRRSGEQAEKAAENPEIAWWYLRPEELRHGRANEMKHMEVAYGNE